MVQINFNFDMYYNKKLFFDYLFNFYFDVELYELLMCQVMIDVIGVDWIFYGFNFGGSDVVCYDLIDGLCLFDDDLQKICWKNVCELLYFDLLKLGKVIV